MPPQCPQIRPDLTKTVQNKVQKRYFAFTGPAFQRGWLALPKGKGPRRHVLIGGVIILIATGVGITTIGVLARRPHAHLHFAPGWLAVAIIGLTLVELAQAELWRRLLLRLGARIEWRRGLAIWCVSALARYVPTSMLMPILRIGMSRPHKVPRNICVVSLIYEAVLAVNAGLFVGAYFMVGLPAFRNSAWRWGIVLVPLISMLALHPRGVRFISDRLPRRLGQTHLLTYLGPRQLLRFATGYIASFLIAGACLLAVVIACHPLSPQHMPAVIGAYAVGFIASLFAFLIPGGLGVREVALVAVLSPSMPVVVATAAALTVRLIQIFTELLLASLTAWMAARQESYSNPALAPAKSKAHAS